jgi:hypothetical protein
MRYLKGVVLGLGALAPLSAEAASSVDRAAYWDSIVQTLATTLFGLFFVTSIVILVLSGYFYMKYIGNPQSFTQTTNMQPMTVGKLVGALALAGAMYAPLHTMELFADLTGLVRQGSGMEMCSALNVDAAHFNWEQAAVSCVDKAEENMARLVGFADSEKLNALNPQLLLSLVQFLALAFFFGSGVKAARHLWGSRDVKGSIWTAIVAMIASSIMFVLPNLVYYIDDFRGEDNVALDSVG